MRSPSLMLAVFTLTACEPNPSQEESTADKEAPVTETTPSLDTPMKRDLDRICNAEEQSGALHEIPGARAQHVAVWLATTLESQEARTMSAELAALAPPERKTRLKDVLTAHGMSDCEILATW